MWAIRHQGVTLIELLIGITILAIVSALAVPAFQNIMLNRKVANMKDSVISSLRFAQSQASKSNYPIVFCATANFSTCSTSGNDWKQGWMIYERKAAAIVAADILRVYQAPKADVSNFAFVLTRNVGGVGTTAFSLEFVSGGLPALGHANATVQVCNQKSRELFTISVRPSGVIDEAVSIATTGCPT